MDCEGGDLRREEFGLRFVFRAGGFRAFFHSSLSPIERHGGDKTDSAVVWMGLFSSGAWFFWEDLPRLEKAGALASGLTLRTDQYWRLGEGHGGRLGISSPGSQTSIRRMGTRQRGQQAG